MSSNHLLSSGFPTLEAVPSYPSHSPPRVALFFYFQLPKFSSFPIQDLYKFIDVKSFHSPLLFCLLRSLTAVTYSIHRCQGKREHKQEQYHSRADTANKDISRTRAVQPKENTSKAEHNTQMDISCRHCRIWYSTRDTKMSIYISQKQQKTRRDSSNVNPQVAEPGEGGRPFWPAVHISIYIELPSPVTSSISLSTNKC